jgi:D-glycero-D-manno-heptose 1,7-bisphosphate phosphatase
MNRAVFLDRDGVINMELGDYVWEPRNFFFCPGIVENLKELQRRGYKLVVITNQGGIDKGVYTHEDVRNTLQFMEDGLAEAGVKLDSVFYSPHHISVSNSIDRKPESLMYERAIYRHDVDVTRSFMIGDKERDIIPAEKLGMKGFLIEKNVDIAYLLNEEIPE